jgi:hypothetical protein
MMVCVGGFFLFGVGWLVMGGWSLGGVSFLCAIGAGAEVWFQCDEHPEI